MAERVRSAATLMAGTYISALLLMALLHHG